MTSYLIVRRRALRPKGTWWDNEPCYLFRTGVRWVTVTKSQLPWCAGMAGLALLILLAFAALGADPDLILWDRVWWLALVGFLLIGPGMVQWLTGWQLVVVRHTATRSALREMAPYGPMCRDPDLCVGKGYCPRDPTCGD